MAAHPSDLWESDLYRLDAQGRLYVPREVRDALRIDKGGALAFRVKNGKVSLHRVSYKVED
jgi:AbrB family looped-hinge helix DNA binding protein